MKYLILISVNAAWWDKHIAPGTPCVYVGGDPTCPASNGIRQIAAIVEMPPPSLPNSGVPRSGNRIRELLAEGKGFPIRLTLGPIGIDNTPPYGTQVHRDIVVGFTPPEINLCDVSCGIIDAVSGGGALPVHFTGENGDAG